MDIQNLNDAETTVEQFVEAVRNGVVFLRKSTTEFAVAKMAEGNQVHVVCIDLSTDDPDEYWIFWMSLPAEMLEKLIRATKLQSIYEAINKIDELITGISDWDDELLFASVFDERSPIKMSTAMELLGFDWREHM